MGKRFLPALSLLMLLVGCGNTTAGRVEEWVQSGSCENIRVNGWGERRDGDTVTISVDFTLAYSCDYARWTEGFYRLQVGGQTYGPQSFTGNCAGGVRFGKHDCTAEFSVNKDETKGSMDFILSLPSILSGSRELRVTLRD